MNYRPEIDGLRAIAVLSVIFYHFFPNIFSGGFVGVDIFFVISGFLITKNVKYATENKQFSLVEFYSNRIIRLFPALILVILFSLAIGYLILLEDEFIKLSHHAIGGAFFVPNLVFILETGYFNQESITKPLLHLWSLGIEEQFYLLFPLIFIFLPYCKETLFIFFCFLISFFYCMSLTVNDQVIAFYSPFSRAWELLAGALIALGEEKRIDYKLKTFVSLFPYFVSKHLSSRNAHVLCTILVFSSMAALVVALFLVNSSYSHPGAVTLVPVAATASTILFSKGGNLIVKLLQLRILVVLGLISYPLYLWHWPLLTFTRITFGESLSILNSLFVIAISIVAAGLTFYFVERNIKKIKNKKGLSLTLLLLLLSIGSSGFILSKLEFFKVRLSEYSSLTNAVKWDNHWSDLKCQQSLKLYPCKITSQQPKVHIFGDSHGNHLFPGLEKIFDKSILAGGSCAPFEHIKVVPSKNKHLLPCHDSQSVTQNLELLSHFRSIEIVVLSYFTYPVLTGKFTDNATEELFGSTDLISSFPQDKGLKRDELFFRGISRTIRKIEETSKQVIFVRDTPFVFNDLFSFCNISRLKLDGISNCYISKNDFLKVREPEERFVRRLRTEFPDVAVVDPIESFCDKSNCYFIKNGIPFFRDNHHLSISGSELLARQIRKEFEQKFDNSSDI